MPQEYFELMSECRADRSYLMEILNLVLKNDFISQSFFMS